MVIWDFDENKNYKIVMGYKVLDLPYKKEAAKLLYKIESKIYSLFMRLKNIRIPELELLINTPFKLQEMQLIGDQGSIKFEGLNKPKNVINTKKQKIGLDGSLRATNRLIFLTIRNKYGKFKKIEELYPLIAHELTHTALNHVMWRKDDHPKEFKVYYKLLLRLLF